MNERIQTLRERALKREYEQYRNGQKSEKIYKELAGKLHDSDMSDVERMTYRFVCLMDNEDPVILADEKFVFTRTISKIPDIYSEVEMDKIKSEHYIHEAGYVCNIAADYSSIIEKGLNDKLLQIKDSEYGGCLIRCVQAIERLAKRYAKKAKELGRTDIAELLENIPQNGAETFKEALQFFRLLHFSMWLSGSYHNVIGRFDQFMYKYYKNDIDNGNLTNEEALELLEEFFISFNKDSSLYPGVQQGDNGQSLVLGGYIAKDNDGFNELSKLCLQASLNVRLIDPKINLRVNKSTPLNIYKMATQLTKQGLGFPQYANDDIVIDGLVKLGYEYDDAINYVAAACWEFIIPGCAMDIPNIGALSFVNAVNKCTNEKLIDCADFGEFFGALKNEIATQLKNETEKFKNLYIIPAPVMTLFFPENINTLTDISKGTKYNNYGIHGTGIANAADSVYAIKKHIFDLKDMSANDLVAAVRGNYENYEELKNVLKYNTYKMGMDDDEVDGIATELIDIFSSELAKYKNERNGIYRAGTGSAMYYIWHSRDEGASADGRCMGEAISANFSPSLDVGSMKPLSVIKSFTKADMRKAINGGPLTLELHDSVFRNDDGIEKTAMLVCEYIKRGGHQLQINTVNRDMLIKAKENPAEYKNLIVRVWGWSGYFVELDEEYQDHIIKRAEYEYI
jgi:Pyruvate-formate lyase